MSLDEFSPSQSDLHLRRIENDMLRFIEEVHDAANNPNITYEGAKELLAKVDETVKERDKFEATLPAEILSPLYFETSGALDVQRKHLADGIARFEADAQRRRNSLD